MKFVFQIQFLSLALFSFWAFIIDQIVLCIFLQYIIEIHPFYYILKNVFVCFLHAVKNQLDEYSVKLFRININKCKLRMQYCSKHCFKWHGVTTDKPVYFYYRYVLMRQF